MIDTRTAPYAALLLRVSLGLLFLATGSCSKSSPSPFRERSAISRASAILGTSPIS